MLKLIEGRGAMEGLNPCCRIEHERLKSRLGHASKEGHHGPPARERIVCIEAHGDDDTSGVQEPVSENCSGEVP